MKFISLTTINMYFLLRKVFYNGRRAKIFLQIRRHQQEPVNGA